MTSTSKDQKRLTLVGSAMPEKVYSRLKNLSEQRVLTPFIIDLVEKEERLDKLLGSLSNLSTLIEKVDRIETRQEEIHKKIIEGGIRFQPIDDAKEIQLDEVKEGKLITANNVYGGIEEDTEGIDY